MVAARLLALERCSSPCWRRPHCPPPRGRASVPAGRRRGAERTDRRVVLLDLAYGERCELAPPGVSARLSIRRVVLAELYRQSMMAHRALGPAIPPGAAPRVDDRWSSADIVRPHDGGRAADRMIHSRTHLALRSVRPWDQLVEARRLVGCLTRSWALGSSPLRRPGRVVPRVTRRGGDRGREPALFRHWPSRRSRTSSPPLCPPAYRSPTRRGRWTPTCTTPGSSGRRVATLSWWS